MNRPIRFLLPNLLAALLIGCASHPPKSYPRAASQPAPKHARPIQQAMALPLPPREPSQRTVEDVLQDFGPYAIDQLKPYFARAGVTFPPRELTLVALKAEKKLELWASGDGEYRLIRDYDILAASGTAGPKLRQGDRQVPEGVYRIVGLNPNSNFHLSMKLNYPNSFDLFHAAREGRDDPGSDIFIHGKDRSIGCLAMGDAAIDELFVLVARVGVDHVKVVIAPHDPRAYPLDPGTGELPIWTDELYAMIASEIQALGRPATVSSATSIHRSRPDYRRSSGSGMP
jgi:hypothetical protein